MRQANLMLHCGANKVEAADLLSVPTPEATKSWTPIPHAELLAGVMGTLQRSGLEIVSQSHGITKEGNRYFGLLQVANGHQDDDFGLIVGLRNSHDKMFPAGLVVGASVFVCDNLSFSGEVTLARKHTAYIRRDLPQLITAAVGKLGSLRQTQDARFSAYRGASITDLQAHDLVIRSLDAGVLPVTRIPAVLGEWRKPSHPEFAPRNAWSLFNCFSEVLKGQLDYLPRRTQALHGLLDTACGLHDARQAVIANPV